jgi:hypothetical protein
MQLLHLISDYHFTDMCFIVEPTAVSSANQTCPKQRFIVQHHIAVVELFYSVSVS